MKVLSSLFGAPLEPHAVGYAGVSEGLGYSGLGFTRFCGHRVKRLLPR